MQNANNNKVCSLIDESFKPGFINKNFLTIEISNNFLSYCILDTSKYQYRLIESFVFEENYNNEALPSKFEEIVTSNEYLLSDFERVTLLYTSQHNVLMPSELFFEKEKDKYLEFNYNKPGNQTTCYEKLHNLQAYSIYTIPNKLKQKFDEYFKTYRLRHFSSVLIESILYDIKNNDLKADIIINIQTGNFEIIILDGSKLLFYNSFKYKTWEDIMYYLFFVMEQFEIISEEKNIILTGKVSIESEIYSNLTPYFKNVDLGARGDLFKYHEIFDNIPHNYFYNLLNANACG